MTELSDYATLQTLEQREAKLTPLFMPETTTMAALSPDGKLLAYTKREGTSLHVVVVDAVDTTKVLSNKEIMTDRDSTPGMDDSAEMTPANVRWLGWVTPTRLVMETNKVFLQPVGENAGWRSFYGAIMSMDADGGNARYLATPFDLEKIGFESAASRGVRAKGGKASERAESAAARVASREDGPGVDGSLPESPTNLEGRNPRTLRVMDFSVDDPESIIVRADSQYSYGIYKINAVTGKRSTISEQEMPPLSYCLADQKGVARIFLPRTTDTAFPHYYLYAKTQGLSRWQNLANIVKSVPEAASFYVSPDNYFKSRAIPLGFDHNPDILYYASNMGRDTYGVYALNTKTGERVKFALENDKFDLITPAPAYFPGGDAGKSILVFDRYTREFVGIRYNAKQGTTQWVSPLLQTVQSSMEAALPGRSVFLHGWNADGTRFLASTNGPSDPGAFYIYDRPAKKLNEFVRIAPWIDTAALHEAVDFSFPAKDGSSVTGILTMPSNIKVRRLPVIVVCPPQPSDRVKYQYNPETQALAGMGFVIIEMNNRRAWGFGTKRRESGFAAGCSATQAADIFVALDELAKYIPIDLKCVAVMGGKYGGYMALRALQLHPERFRCAIAVDSPINPKQWLNEIKLNTGDVSILLTENGLDSAADLNEEPLIKESQKISRPVCVFNYRGETETEDTRSMRLYATAEQFVEAVRRNGAKESEFHTLESDYMRGLPKARSTVFLQIEDFLNTVMYDYGVNVGPMRIVDPKAAAKPGVLTK